MRRFSIAAPMLVVLVCGVAVAALKQASDAWAGALLMLTLALLGSAVFGLVYRREGRRAFWFGFAAFGWGYLVLTMGPWFAEQVGPKLPTTPLLTYAHERLHPSETNDAIQRLKYTRLVTRYYAARKTVLSSPTQPSPVAKGYKVVALVQVSQEQLIQIGHCLFALLAAVGGGPIARGSSGRTGCPRLMRTRNVPY